MKQKIILDFLFQLKCLKINIKIPELGYINNNKVLALRVHTSPEHIMHYNIQITEIP